MLLVALLCSIGWWLPASRERVLPITNEHKPFAVQPGPEFSSSSWSLQLPPERSLRAVLRRLGQHQAGLLIAKLVRVVDVDTSGIGQVAGGLPRDDLRPRSSTSLSRCGERPSFWRFGAQ